MARIKISFPEPVVFTTTIPVRITDLNYGGHVGNDTILTIAHEVRMQFLSASGFTELDFGGIGMIMSDAVIEFKSEVFYGDSIHAEIAMGEISKFSFELYYRFTKKIQGEIIALVKTGMICYDYERKKVAAIPDAAKIIFIR
ncbi:MAG: thioesterase family protein [Gemmatimonadaceae bacterium]|nr:thioesterase family protein [Chitinophagaceae bacterium]